MYRLPTVEAALMNINMPLHTATNKSNKHHFMKHMKKTLLDQSTRLNCLYFNCGIQKSLLFWELQYIKSPLKPYTDKISLHFVYVNNNINPIVNQGRLLFEHLRVMAFLLAANKVDKNL